MIKLVLLLIFSLVHLQTAFASSLPNWPLSLMPGKPQPLNVSNALSYRLFGYCASGQGDVTVEFGNLTFVTPCIEGLGAYRLVEDVSAEVFTNPIRHCASQGLVTSVCSAYVSNFLAPPNLIFNSSPISEITILNQTSYTYHGQCSPVGAGIDISLSGVTLTGTCLADHSFLIFGDLSSVPDGIGLTVTGSINFGGTTTVLTTVNKLVSPVWELQITPFGLFSTDTTPVVLGTFSSSYNGTVVNLYESSMCATAVDSVVITSGSANFSGVTYSGLGLDDGLHQYFVGYLDPITGSNICLSAGLSYSLDTQPPTPVTSALFSQDWSTDLALSPVFNWLQGSDLTSGVQRHEVSLGSLPGLDDIQSWLTSANPDQHQFSGLSLVECQSYWANIRVVDNVNLVSSTASTSNFFRPDATPPLSPVIDVSVLDALSNRGMTTSWLAVTDNCGGTVNYEYSISTTPDSSGIIPGGGWIALGTTTTAQIATGITLSAGTNYYSLVKAIDLAGNEIVVASTAWQICPIGQQVFNFTGADQVFTAPAWCSRVAAKIWGGGGGGYGSGYGANATGGGAGYTGAVVPVTAGGAYTVVVGGGGRPYPNYFAYGGGGRGSGNQTAPGCDCGGSGGGRSELRLGATVMLVAGAGGGGGDPATAACRVAGAGGGLNGVSVCLATGGGPGVYSPNGGNASLATCNNRAWCGGGGAGYRGGGPGIRSGAQYMAGAGGSGHVYASAFSGSTFVGSAVTPGNPADPDRLGAGQGGAHGGNGANGRVIISWGLD